MTNYGEGGPLPDSGEYPDYAESAEVESAPAPWYRNRVLLAVWATMVAILIVLIIYGLIQLSHGGGGGPFPTTPSTTSTPTQSSTTTPSAPSTTTTPPSTATNAPPPETTPEEQPPPQETSPAPGEPPHHHHLHIPSTITLPHTVITLPPGF
jgi:hypothetical protein